MINYCRINRKFIAIILFLVILSTLLLCLCSYSEISRELNNNNRIIKREFYQRLNEIYFLENIDSLTEEQWNSICLAVNINCFILDTFEFDILCSNDKVATIDKIKPKIDNYFCELNDKLSKATFNSLTSEQKEYFECIGNQIHSALGSGNNNFFSSLYSYIE